MFRKIKSKIKEFKEEMNSIEVDYSALPRFMKETLKDIFEGKKDERTK